MTAPGRAALPSVELDPQAHLGAAEHRRADAHVPAGRLGEPAHDVQAEPGRAVAARAPAAGHGGLGVGDAGPRVGHQHDHRVVAVVHVHREGGALGGVPEDVAQQGVQGGGEVGAGHGDAHRPLHSGHAHLAVLVLGERRPERHPLADDLGGVAPGARTGRRGLRLGLAGGADDGVDLALQLGDRGPGLLGGGRVAERGRVQPQHGQRGAQPVGQVGGQLPLVGEELDDLVGHRVERHGRAPQFGRALLGDPHPELSLPQLVRPLGQPLRGLHHAHAQPVGDRDRAHHQRGADGGEHRPGRADAVGDLRLGHEHLDHHGPGAERDGLQQRGAAGHLGGGGAAEAAHGGDVLLGGAPPAQVDGGPAVPGRQVHGEAVTGAGGGEDPLQLLAVGGDGQRGHQDGGLPLGVGEGTVAGHLPHHQPERHGERHHDHGGDRQADLDQRPSHRACSRPREPSPGGSSFTPTPRRVCR